MELWCLYWFCVVWVCCFFFFEIIVFILCNYVLEICYFFMEIYSCEIVFGFGFLNGIRVIKILRSFEFGKGILYYIMVLNFWS